jgi:hypothetical protein
VFGAAAQKITTHHRENALKLQTLTAVTIAAWGLSACGTMDAPPATDRHAGMNADQKCAMYRETMEGRSPAEQRAAAEAHVEAMHGTADAAHVDRHLRMMEQMCGARPDAGTMRR